jgi:hypothetical protein
MFHTLTLTLSLMFSLLKADVYMHNPRASNNRCDELTNDRLNANRLFDSQNNAAGGYAIGCNKPDAPLNVTCFNMNYYEETVLPITWTSQHNCGEDNNCEIILQYMCSDDIRDGRPQNTLGNTCTQTIPNLEDSAIDNFLKYGKHEDYSSYLNCNKRKRFLNLFTADQVLRGQSSIYTRQNPNGDRYGFECPEERDYYPYWGQSEWRDIAILTSNLSRCEYYINNSRCTTDKFECLNAKGQNETECLTNKGEWKIYNKFSNCNLTCAMAPLSTVNRLSIGQNSTEFNQFFWRLPQVKNQNIENKTCVLRIRYNITSKEVPWEFTSLDNFKLKNNPIVNSSLKVPLRLAIDTSQFGRTFEDRSWAFTIIKRPVSLVNKTIHNVNVQGKRGNIAQVRNCVEYDFVPNRLTVQVNDYMHFQWLGSDYNPLNNDGEGKRGTDRSNLIQIDSMKDNSLNLSLPEIFNNFVKYNLATIGQEIDNPFKCFTFAELTSLKNIDEHVKNCALLNSAEPYFNMLPIKLTQNDTGNFTLMSSRNNNFSNRAQKIILHIINQTTIADAQYSIENLNGKGVKASVIIAAAISCIILSAAIFVVYTRRVLISSKIKSSYNSVTRSFASEV